MQQPLRLALPEPDGGYAFADDDATVEAVDLFHLQTVAVFSTSDGGGIGAAVRNAAAGVANARPRAPAGPLVVMTRGTQPSRGSVRVHRGARGR